jgi:putative restriction endonuclease
MAAGIRWKREELLIVLNLYHKLRFGQFDARQPVIIDLAQRMGRTPGSVAMKLSNLASLDPALKLRGIKGLPGASDLDREMWEEFHENPAELVPLSQERFDSLFIESPEETTEVIAGTGIRRYKNPPTGETEYIAPAKRRRGQQYFSDVVFNNYGNRCAITGIPIRELLVASHILPWSSHEKERLNVRNGICLNRLHDGAFDKGLIGFDSNYRLIISPKLRFLLSGNEWGANFKNFESQMLNLPDDGVLPREEFLLRHRMLFKLG